LMRLGNESVSMWARTRSVVRPWELCDVTA
jgi:hypothetical protein